jgi:hypothetical protein
MNIAETILAYCYVPSHLLSAIDAVVIPAYDIRISAARLMAAAVKRDRGGK